MSLTDRQNEILKAIIEEHIECAQPIGSLELVEKQSLNVSGATVRNIMADLVRLGYLNMMHVSSGRVPTDRAYRYYITELLIEGEVSLLDEVALRQKVWDERYELERLLANSAHALSEATGSMCISLTDDGFSAYAGISKILEMPEFYEIDVTRSVFRIVDDYELAKSIFSRSDGQNSLSILIGREIGLANMEPITVISTSCVIGGKKCYIGMLGPSRLRYNRIIPIVRYISQLLDEVGSSV
ncbi:hypothetical protein CO178_01765 [candidate division WWE3 bacterium CG_4_9_14_3_um_filter_34_6]|uniref:Heat-inducible transcription repressor HrcA C-terminal domain-containing protein n=1 Tax=candidate division WWE3 bacterium CG_4_9_14_3_um_filter_34_6 TaxID=1975079 RepID=A0A2M7X3A0_UNCKA|nr:MAG: hypothetical protein CO178_01765 [candidate division WWE3 bacterium CG_4_9_14_3_um_filter_34_6]